MYLNEMIQYQYMKNNQIPPKIPLKDVFMDRPSKQISIDPVIIDPVGPVSSPSWSWPWTTPDPPYKTTQGGVQTNSPVLVTRIFPISCSIFFCKAVCGWISTILFDGLAKIFFLATKAEGHMTAWEECERRALLHSQAAALLRAMQRNTFSMAADCGKWQKV